MNPTIRRLLTATVVLPLVALSGCGEAQGTTLRTAFLKSLGEDTILPAYRDFDTRSATLATALDALDATPTEATLTQAQTAWRAVREPWGMLAVMSIGPSENLRTVSAVDQVSSPSGIDSVLTSTTKLTVENVEQLGTNRKGMMALEYLLFDAKEGSAAVLARFTAEGEPGTRRRAYARALGEVLHNDATAVRTAWEPDGGDFVSRLANAGVSSIRYATQKDAVDEVVNRFISSVEVAELKLSKPLGFETGGTVRPDEERSRRSDNSIADLRANVAGMERLWFGADGKSGLSGIVASTNKKLDGTVRADLSRLRGALEAIPPPLRTALLENRESVEAARAAFSTLRATLATEVVSNLGVTLKFNDNDGD
ncbi:imelysin family protein [Archangium primigenium]|uniref:imelysin family protein n=1 Tax=[Archangium] primigenium TaxID=2792470 RepID=UPI0019562F0A|nr:imelysin family protein [Archangium primigenium]